MRAYVAIHSGGKLNGASVHGGVGEIRQSAKFRRVPPKASPWQILADFELDYLSTMGDCKQCGQFSV
jgi:hypothetical protein